MSLGGSVHTRHSEKVAYGSKMLVDITAVVNVLFGCR